MIQIKSQLSKKDKVYIGLLINELEDSYRHFYITKDRVRYFIKDNINLFFDYLKKGDKIVFNDEGIIFITGWSDKFPRKYVRILGDSLENLDNLFKVVNWNIYTDLYCKINKNHPAIKILEKNGFQYRSNRGNEVLYIRKNRGAKNVIKYNKDQD